MAIIVFFIATLFFNFITSAHISGVSVSNEIRVLTSLCVALTACCFLLIINLSRRVPRFFNAEDIVDDVKEKALGENELPKNAGLVQFLGDVIRKETLQGNIDVASAALRRSKIFPSTTSRIA